MNAYWRFVYDRRMIREPTTLFYLRPLKVVARRCSALRFARRGSSTVRRSLNGTASG